MICNKCGATIDDKSLFCGYCGNKVSNDVNPVPSGASMMENAVNNTVNNIGMNVPTVDSSSTLNQTSNSNTNAVPNVNGLNQVNQQVNPAVENINGTINSVVGETSGVLNTSVNQDPAINNIQDVPVVQNIFENNEVSPIASNVQSTMNEIPPTNGVDSVPPVEPNGPKEPTKKKNNMVVGIIIGVAAVLVVGILITLLVFGSKSKNTVSVLNKAVNNYITKGKENGTVRLSALIESSQTGSINLSADFKYEKSGDEYNFEAKLNKSIFFDEINVYAKGSKDDITLYAKSSLVDLLGFTKSDTDTWLYYMINLSDFEAEEEDLDFDSFDASDILDSKSFKYIDESNGVRHYQLVIDNSLMSKIDSELSDTEKEDIDSLVKDSSYSDILEKGINIDFYINKSNELQKVSIDLSKYIEDDSVSKAVLSMEFIDLGSTTVNIPNDVLYTTMDFTTYFSNNSTLTQGDEETQDNTFGQDNMFNQNDMFNLN